MHKVTKDKENIKVTVTCPCTTSTRRNDRPPFAVIQDSFKRQDGLSADSKTEAALPAICYAPCSQSSRLTRKSTTKISTKVSKSPPKSCSSTSQKSTHSTRTTSAITCTAPGVETNAQKNYDFAAKCHARYSQSSRPTKQSTIKIPTKITKSSLKSCSSTSQISTRSSRITSTIPCTAPGVESTAQKNYLLSEFSHKYYARCSQFSRSTSPSNVKILTEISKSCSKSSSSTLQPSSSSIPTSTPVLEIACTTQKSEGVLYPELANKRARSSSRSVNSNDTWHLNVKGTNQRVSLSQKSTSHYNNSSGYISGSSLLTPKIFDAGATLPSQHFVTLTENSNYSTSPSIEHFHASQQLEECMEYYCLVAEDADNSGNTDLYEAINDCIVMFKRANPIEFNTEPQFKNVTGYSEDKIKQRPQLTPKLSRRIPNRQFRSNLTDKASNTGRIPAVKSTLMRQQNSKLQITFPLLYSPDYIEDIISYSFMIQNELTLRGAWIRKYFDIEARAKRLDWILEICSMKKYMESVYYMTVRLFDYVILNLKLKNEYYSLAAIVSFWLSAKYNETREINATDVYLLCKKKFSKKEILNMERTILKTVNSCLKMADPMDFLYYYLKRAKRENDESLKCGAKFVLECSTLFGSYSIIRSSFMAAAAVYMAYQTIYESTRVPLDFRWYDAETIDYFVQQHLKFNISCAVKNKYKPTLKYSDAKKMGVAKKFI